MKSTPSQVAPQHEAIDAKAECRLLDSVRAGFNISSDAALAAWLGIDKSMISCVRSGTKKLGLIQRLKILDRIGFLKTRTFVESLLPERLAADLVAISQSNASHQAEEALARICAENENVKLIDAAKIAFHLSTDAELAQILDVRDTTISMVRRKKTALGVLPKLRLLARVTTEFQFQPLVDFLKSSQLLSDAIEKWAESGSS